MCKADRDISQKVYQLQLMSKVALLSIDMGWGWILKEIFPQKFFQIICAVIRMHFLIYYTTKKSE